MKYLVKIFLTLGIVLWGFEIKAQQDHIGIWEGADNHGSVGAIEMDEDGYASFTINNQQFGGREFDKNGVLVKLVYEIDYMADPIALVLILKEVSNDMELNRLNGILTFIDEDTIKVRIDFSGNREIRDFESENGNDVILLKRKTF